jgi:hypothetical protein
MPGREKARFHGRLMVMCAAALAGLVALGVASPAIAKKKRSKSPAVTATNSAPLSSGTTQTLTSACPKGTHITGGGYSIAPTYDPASNTGSRTLTETSFPAGPKTWSATSSALTNPPATGSFSTLARCERDSAGKLSVLVSSTALLSPGGGSHFPLNCPTGSHVISGGFAGEGPNVLSNVFGFRIIVLESRRTGPGQWTVTAFNRTGSPTAAQISVYALCEKNAKGVSVSEKSGTVPMATAQRATADASCPKKQHVVSGGFLVSPDTFPGSVAVVGIDEDEPVGKASWRVALYAHPSFNVPAGGSLQTTAYCKKDAAPKKKR